MRTRSPLTSGLILGLLGLALVAPQLWPGAVGQEAPPEPELPGLAAIDSAVAPINTRLQADDLSPEERARLERIKADWEEARRLLQRFEQAEADKARAEREQADVPAQIKAAEQVPDEGLPEPPPQTGAALEAEIAAAAEAGGREFLEVLRERRDEGELRRQNAEAAALQAEKQAELLVAERERRRQLVEEINVRLAELQSRLPEARQALEADPPLELGPDGRRALKARQQWRLKFLVAEIPALQARLSSIDARKELLPKRIDQARRRAKLASDLRQAYADFVAQLNKQISEREAREARKLLRQKLVVEVPSLAAVAREIDELASARAGTLNAAEMSAGGDDSDPELDLRSGLTERITARRREEVEVSGQLKGLRASFAALNEKVEKGGVTAALGQLLRRRLMDLPSASQLALRAEVLRRRAAQAAFDEITYRDRRDELGLIDEELEQFRQQALREADDSQASYRDELAQAFEAINGEKPIAQQLLDKRRDLLRALISDTQEYQAVLDELEQELLDLAAASREFRRFVEIRILWVRSVTDRNVWPSPALAAEALQAALGADVRALGARVSRGIWSRPLEATGWLLALAVLLAGRSRFRRVLEHSGKRLWGPEDRFGYSLEAVGLSLLVALGPAVSMGAVSWTLTFAPEDADPFREPVHALARGLYSAAVTLFPLEVLRQVLRRGGLAEKHFRWRKATIHHVRWHLRWLIVAYPALVVIYMGYDEYESRPEWSESLGRLAFLLAMLAQAIFLQRVLRPTGPVMSAFLQRSKGDWIDRLQWVWFPLAVGFPLVLGVLALRGYYYTAIELEWRVLASLWLALALVVAQALVVRFLRLSRLRIAEKQREAEQARLEEERKKQALLQSGEIDAAELAKGDATPVDASGRSFSELLKETEELDLLALNEQIRQLFRSAVVISVVVGFLAIWGDVLPALNKLEELEVFPQPGVLHELDDSGQYPVLEQDELANAEARSGAGADDGAGEVSQPAPPSSPAAPAPGAAPGLPAPSMGGAADGAEASAPVLGTYVSLGDFLLGIVLLIVTWLAAKNVPAFVEVVLLQRFSMDAGARYAATTVTRYALVFLGVTAACAAVGINWSSVQWLAAALTFGLAFGLQEIFANLVSGLIILLERPVRVGDWVTLGGVDGVVTRIRIRATTIMDWDRKEVIVPNKEFVTGRVINWALNDPVSRILMRVGIAYGSDTRLAHATLLRVADEHPKVLKDPEPASFFEGFGASTLDFSLRVFVGSLGDRLQVQHELLTEIDEALQEVGITIAFNQLDVHLMEVPRELLEHRRGSNAPTRDYDLERVVGGSSTTASLHKAGLIAGEVSHADTTRIDVDPQDRPPSPRRTSDAIPKPGTDSSSRHSSPAPEGSDVEDTTREEEDSQDPVTTAEPRQD